MLRSHTVQVCATILLAVLIPYSTLTSFAQRVLGANHPKLKKILKAIHKHVTYQNVSMEDLRVQKNAMKDQAIASIDDLITPITPQVKAIVFEYEAFMSALVEELMQSFHYLSKRN